MASTISSIRLSARHQSMLESQSPRKVAQTPLTVRKHSHHTFATLGGGLPSTTKRTTAGNVVARSEPRTLTTDPRRLVDMSDTITDPYGSVEDAMTNCYVDGSGCKTVTIETLVKDCENNLEQFTGLPVVNAEDIVVGVLSDKDVASAKEKNNNEISATLKVGDIMTSPAIVTLPHARITYAAALMLQNQIHRVPVVDSGGKLLGVLTRSDVFEPLLCDPYAENCLSDPLYRKNASNPGSSRDLGVGLSQEDGYNG